MDPSRKLEQECAKLRRAIVEMIHHAGSGHAGGSLSAVEILEVLYRRIMKIDPARPAWEDRDRLVLSKGHAAPALYAVLADAGFFPSAVLKTLRSEGSILQGHPDMSKTPGVDISTGSLGMGVSNGVGLALAARLAGKSWRTYVLCGDGELNEGQIWEGLMAAAKFRADSLTVVVDRNNVQLDGTTDEIMPTPHLDKRFAAFGCHVMECDGHSVDSLTRALEQCLTVSGKPQVIIAHTVKGKGVSFMEGKNTWHGAPITREHYRTAMAELTLPGQEL